MSKFVSRKVTLSILKPRHKAIRDDSFMSLYLTALRSVVITTEQVNNIHNWILNMIDRKHFLLALTTAVGLVAPVSFLPQMEVAEQRLTTRSFEESSHLHLVVQQQRKKKGRRQQERTLIRQ